MDIRKWLDETVQPEAPRDPINPQQTAKPAKRKRRRSSDSSILDPRPPASSPHRSVDNSAGEAVQATCSDSSSSSRYARKPRRKTRLERYEPAPHAHGHCKGESKKTRRKPRCKKSEMPPGVMHTFQAKNVSGDRLTLKPREQLGLFNKGRTSTAIKGRGLPDLVFSEMKFLQKHRDEPESVPRPDITKKKRKKDHEQTKEGEISAFFSSVRPVLVDKDVVTVPQQNVSKTKRHCHDQPSVNDTAIPTVEAVNQESYLGFGNRGPRHESDRYVSWSESIRAPSTTPARPGESYARPSSRDVDFHDEFKTGQERENNNFKLPARPPSVTKRRTDSTPVGRFRVSSLAPSHSRASRSQSHPQCTSSPRRPNLVDRSAKPEVTVNARSPSSMPLFAPKRAMNTRRAQPHNSSKASRSGTTPVSRVTAPSEYRQHKSSVHSPAAEDRIPTSSDLGVILRQCNDTFHERSQVTGLRRRHTERMHLSYPHADLRQNTRDFRRAAQHVPTVRFADQLYHEPITANFTGPSIYEQQARRQQLPLHSEPEEGPLLSPYLVDKNSLDQHDGTEYDDQMVHNDQNWAGLPGELMSRDFEDDLDTYDDGDACTGTFDDLVQDLRQENDTVAPGFWRPNKLY